MAVDAPNVIDGPVWLLDCGLLRFPHHIPVIAAVIAETGSPQVSVQGAAWHICPQTETPQELPSASRKQLIVPVHKEETLPVAVLPQGVQLPVQGQQSGQDGFPVKLQDYLPVLGKDCDASGPELGIKMALDKVMHVRIGPGKGSGGNLDQQRIVPVQIDACLNGAV